MTPLGGHFSYFWSIFVPAAVLVVSLLATLGLYRYFSRQL